MGENRNSHYLINRDHRKKKAEKHVQEIAMQCTLAASATGVNLIENSIQNTRLYDDNIFSHVVKRPMTTKELFVVDLDSVAAVFHYYDKDKKNGCLKFCKLQTSRWNVFAGKLCSGRKLMSCISFIQCFIKMPEFL